MTITATDFQLHVNEYFTRLMQGEEIIIERYGKKFAVLLPYDQVHNKPVENPGEPVETSPDTSVGILANTVAGRSVVSQPFSGIALSQDEVTKLIRVLLAQLPS